MTSTMNRRALMAGAATLTAIAVPAAAQPALAAPDPIFAAIEGHRRAWASLETCSANDKAAEVRLSRAIDAAEDALLEVIPTSIAGVVALFNYHFEFAVRDGDDLGSNDYKPDGLPDQRHGVGWAAALHYSLEALPEIVARERASAA